MRLAHHQRRGARLRHPDHRRSPPHRRTHCSRGRDVLPPRPAAPPVLVDLDRGDHRRPAARPSTGLRPKARGWSATSVPVEHRAEAGWCANPAACLRACGRTRWRLSSRTCAPTGIGPWRWPRYWAPCGRPRSAPAAGQRPPGLRRVRVVGKGNKERTVPTDRASSPSWQLPAHRAPVGLCQPGMLRRAARPIRGRPLTEAGMRRIFRTHRASSGSSRVRPHRLRHTYGTELATAGSTYWSCVS